MAKLILNLPEARKFAGRKALPRVSRVMRQTLNLTRRTAPVGTPGLQSAPTGARLRSSLQSEGPKVTTSLISGRVGSRLKYAATVSKGSKPHEIRARRKKTLKFYWNRVNRTVYPVRVFHPGRRRPDRYMTRALRVVGFINRFKVKITDR